MLARHYIARQSLRGGDVQAFGAAVTAKTCLPRGIDAAEWRWKDVISTRWQVEGEHINVYEARAYLLTLRWRLRNWHHVGTKFLHLVDSRVTQGCCVKGRSSSHRMRRVLCKINALCLAGFITPYLGYVRSHQNPADRPSRFLRPKAKSLAVTQSFTKRKSSVPTKPRSFCAAQRQRLQS